MTELFDTHAHFEGSRAETAAMLLRAAQAGVARVMAVGGSCGWGESMAVHRLGQRSD